MSSPPCGSLVVCQQDYSKLTGDFQFKYCGLIDRTHYSFFYITILLVYIQDCTRDKSLNGLGFLSAILEIYHWENYPLNEGNEYKKDKGLFDNSLLWFLELPALKHFFFINHITSDQGEPILQLEYWIGGSHSYSQQGKQTFESQKDNNTIDTKHHYLSKYIY